MHNPFKITEPTCISFSGGRTSAYMLYRILEAHDMQLPDEVVVCFANTGKEEEATLEFVRDCEKYWNVPIVWLEYKEAEETKYPFSNRRISCMMMARIPFCCAVLETENLNNIDDISSEDNKRPRKGLLYIPER